MSSSDAVSELLSGPRGRRLCWSLVDVPRSPGWESVRFGNSPPIPSQLAGELEAAVDVTDLDALGATTDALTLLDPLAEAVSAAKYWQEPDVEDRALAFPEVHVVLAPVARAVTHAPAAQWWKSPAALDRQQYVEWLDNGQGPSLSGAAAKLAAWRCVTIDDERDARKRPSDPSANRGGRWWSSPALSQLPSTTRSIPGLGAVRLALVEDDLGWTAARCWPLEARPRSTVYEISGPDRWVDLVAHYPLDVSKSRRHDWWRATGWSGTWLIPDWQAVAADYDAIHLTVGGYLTTAGRALSVGAARTVLAGWDPDQTYWLADVLSLSGPITRWSCREDGLPAWRVHSET